MSIFQRGETYVHWIKTYNRAGTVTTPTTIKENIYDPCGLLLVNSMSMTTDTTGNYFYNYAIRSTATYGRYTSKVTASINGYVATFKDEFYILPWDYDHNVRSIMGVKDEKSLDDDSLCAIIWSSYQYALRDVHSHHYNETPKGDPATGKGFDGSNTNFQTRIHPLADVNGDGTITGYGQQSCGTDITGHWIDNNGSWNQAYITVSKADNGEITITKTDGTTAIPQDNEGVYIDYWSSSRRYDTELFRQAVTRLACHEISKRMSSLDQVTLADIKSNNPVIMINPSMFWAEYQRYLHKNMDISLAGV